MVTCYWSSFVRILTVRGQLCCDGPEFTCIGDQNWSLYPCQLSIILTYSHNYSLVIPIQQNIISILPYRQDFGNEPLNLFVLPMSPNHLSFQAQDTSMSGFKSSLSPSIMPRGTRIKSAPFGRRVIRTGDPQRPQNERSSTPPDSGLVSSYVRSSDCSGAVYVTC